MGKMFLMWHKWPRRLGTPQHLDWVMTQPHRHFSFGLSIVDFCLWAKGLGKEQGSALGKTVPSRKEAKQRRSCVIKIPCSILDGVVKIKKLKLLLSYWGIPSKIISKFWKSVNVTIASSQVVSLSSCLFPISICCLGCFRLGPDPVACLQAGWFLQPRRGSFMIWALDCKFLG